MRNSLGLSSSLELDDGNEKSAHGICADCEFDGVVQEMSTDRLICLGRSSR
jgi:hypothetical protein